MSPEAIYASRYVSRARRVALALAFGALLPLAGAWWRWARYDRWTLALPEALFGALVALGMITAALRSREVYRVELTPDALLVHRDPGVIDRYALMEITATSEPTPGGWSRDPSETLVITSRDGVRARYRLPDDAHTPGIVDDIAQAQRGTALAETSVAEKPPVT